VCIERKSSIKSDTWVHWQGIVVQPLVIEDHIEFTFCAAGVEMENAWNCSGASDYIICSVSCVISHVILLYVVGSAVDVSWSVVLSSLAHQRAMLPWTGIQQLYTWDTMPHRRRYVTSHLAWVGMIQQFYNWRAV